MCIVASPRLPGRVGLELDRGVGVDELEHPLRNRHDWHVYGPVGKPTIRPFPSTAIVTGGFVVSSPS